MHGDFREAVDRALANEDSSYIKCIPLETGFYRIANVELPAYKLGYISTRGGRWSNDGEASLYLAESPQVCVAELGLGDERMKKVVVEYHVPTRPLRLLDVSQLPNDISKEVYAMTGEAPEKWAKGRILADAIAEHAKLSDVDGLYAPSASGDKGGIQGKCIVLKRCDALVCDLTGNLADCLQGKMGKVPK